MLTSKKHQSNDRNLSQILHTLLILSGNTLTVIGSALLLLGLTNFIQFDVFSFGLSSGIRIVGMVIIAGCLFSAVGYGLLDIIED